MRPAGNAEMQEALMVIKKKRRAWTVAKKREQKHRETVDQPRVVYATKEEIDASISRILKKYAETFRRLAE